MATGERGIVATIDQRCFKPPALEESGKGASNKAARADECDFHFR